MSEAVRVLVADAQKPERDALTEALSRLGYSVFEAESGAKTLYTIEALQPDALVISLELPVKDGYGVLQSLGMKTLARYPYVVMTTAMGRAACEKALSLGADEALERPVTADRVDAALKACKGRTAPALALRIAAAREAAVGAQLSKMGMQDALKGYQYLRRAIALVSVSDLLLHQATSRLYPLIAKEVDATDHSVERAIRHAIETTWTHGNMDALHEVFGNTIDPQRGKPTNTECIAMLAESIRKGT